MALLMEHGVREEMISEALSYNRNLSREFLSTLSIVQVFGHVGPVWRDDYWKRMYADGLIDLHTYQQIKIRLYSKPEKR